MMDDEKLDGGLSGLTDVLGLLADDFECHPMSRSIDDCEAAGRAMREAKNTIERSVSDDAKLRKLVLNAYIEVRYVLAGLAGVALRVAPNDEHMDSVIARLAKLETALTPNAELKGAAQQRPL